MYTRVCQMTFGTPVPKLQFYTKPHWGQLTPATLHKYVSMLETVYKSAKAMIKKNQVFCFLLKHIVVKFVKLTDRCS